MHIREGISLRVQARQRLKLHEWVQDNPITYFLLPSLFHNHSDTLQNEFCRRWLNYVLQMIIW